MDGKYISNKQKDFSVFKYILLGETQLKVYNNIYTNENPLSFQTYKEDCILEELIRKDNNFNLLDKGIYFQFLYISIYDKYTKLKNYIFS